MTPETEELIPLRADTLAPRWSPADPTLYGLDAEALLVRPGEREQYCPTITVSRYAAEQTPAMIAAATLDDAGADARLLERDENADVATQLIEFTPPGGVGVLRVAEAVLVWRSSVVSLRDTCVVARLVCAPAQFAAAASDFEVFVGSLEPNVSS
jgi:hypothetical protein